MSGLASASLHCLRSFRLGGMVATMTAKKRNVLRDHACRRAQHAVPGVAWVKQRHKISVWRLKVTLNESGFGSGRILVDAKPHFDGKKGQYGVESYNYSKAVNVLFSIRRPTPPPRSMRAG